ncbi:hypothetical protein QO005_001939 [Rhizobium paknamense]|uniref:HTH DNA binding domain-containing protein n=1 Tax=Rhizobium paknamense TaxID=1206817 RepID=A0ABU0IBJ0_9HYPH|nr:hypothetical protein [Rhizobium paknamense]
MRLDERLARSAIAPGLKARGDYADAVASLWLDGELVHMEDLVFHDARMDLRSPTHELTLAHLILRTRRDIAAQPPDWPFSEAGLRRLRGRQGQIEEATRVETAVQQPEPTAAPDDAFEAELRAFDALLERTGKVVQEAWSETRSPLPKDPLVYDLDWNEDERLSEWLDVVNGCRVLPPVLAAAVVLDAWQTLSVSEHSPWLGRLLAAAYLVREGTARHHLPAFCTGLKAVPRERRHARSRTVRLLAILEGLQLSAEFGLKEHDRLILARAGLERRFESSRENSRLPQLADFVLSRPMVSTRMVARELSITPQGALILIKALNLRELTGRGRFRAWGIL